MLFLSCLLASGTLSLEAEAKFTLHLKEVCWLKVGGFGGGGRKQALPPSPLSTLGALRLWKPQSWRQDFFPYSEVTH